MMHVFCLFALSLPVSIYVEHFSKVSFKSKIPSSELTTVQESSHWTELAFIVWKKEKNKSILIHHMRDFINSIECTHTKETHFTIIHSSLLKKKNTKVGRFLSNKLMVWNKKRHKIYNKNVYNNSGEKKIRQVHLFPLNWCCCWYNSMIWFMHKNAIRPIVIDYRVIRLCEW